MSVFELKSIAKSLGVKGAYAMKKVDLIRAIEDLKGKPAEKPAEKQVEMKEPTISGEIQMAEAKATPARKDNSWNQHIRAYREEHGCSLREAMAKARETYKPRAES